MGEATQVLAAALAQTGAQDAAHTALLQGRRVAEDRHVLAEQQRRTAAVEAARAHLTDAPLPPAHLRAIKQLDQLQMERDVLGTKRSALERSLRTANDDLANCPRWARGRQRELAQTISAKQAALARTWPIHKELNDRIGKLTVVVDGHRRERTEHAAHELRRVQTIVTARRAELAMPRRLEGPGMHRTDRTPSSLSQRLQHHDHGRDLDRGR
jgi:hypothetical protein